MNNFTDDEKKDIRANWYMRLRQEPPQVQGNLCTNTGHCALGILWLAAGGYFDVDNMPQGLEDRGYGGEQASESQAYTFFEDFLGDEHEVERVYGMNDSGQNKSFTEIAAIVEERYDSESRT